MMISTVPTVEHFFNCQNVINVFFFGIPSSTFYMHTSILAFYVSKQTLTVWAFKIISNQFNFYGQHAYNLHYEEQWAISAYPISHIHEFSINNIISICLHRAIITHQNYTLYKTP